MTEESCHAPDERRPALPGLSWLACCDTLATIVHSPGRATNARWADWKEFFLAELVMLAEHDLNPDPAHLAAAEDAIQRL
jgi:hypothetical protein